MQEGLSGDSFLESEDELIGKVFDLFRRWSKVFWQLLLPLRMQRRSESTSSTFWNFLGENKKIRKNDGCKFSLSSPCFRSTFWIILRLISRKSGPCGSCQLLPNWKCFKSSPGALTIEGIPYFGFRVGSAHSFNISFHKSLCHSYPPTKDLTDFCRYDDIRIKSIASVPL
jgi:hypothetical protein